MQQVSGVSLMQKSVWVFVTFGVLLFVALETVLNPQIIQKLLDLLLILEVYQSGHLSAVWLKLT